MVTNKWKRIKWESTSEKRIKSESTGEIGENRFLGFPILGMMDRKGDDLGPLKGKNLDVVERILSPFLSIILETWILGPIFARFVTENLLITTFKTQFLPQTCWLPIWISKPKSPKKPLCASPLKGQSAQCC